MMFSRGTVGVLCVALVIASAPMAHGKGAKAGAAKSGAGGQNDGTEEFVIPMGGQIQLGGGNGGQEIDIPLSDFGGNGGNGGFGGLGSLINPQAGGGGAQSMG
ncbi:hypothetical protein T484DRAFT_1754693, partial [Baffinella frigidus]